MKKIKLLSMVLVGLLLFSCAVTKNQKKGEVSPKDFKYTTPFDTMKSLMILPFEIEGSTKNFIFDTGADYSLIQRDSMIGKTQKISGASKRKMELGNEIVPSLKIGGINFTNTIALNGDLEGLKGQIPNFGGLVGQPIIGKANWLINYPKKVVTITNQDLSQTDFESIKFKSQDGAPFTFISINGVEQKVIIDFGSSSEINLPEDSKFAKKLLSQYDFIDHERDRYTLGGLQKTKEKVGIIPVVKLGALEFRNVRTTINASSQPRIGIAFFKDCVIYIDNIHNTYKIQK